MDNKLRSMLDRALQDKAKGNHQKALKRLNEALAKYPNEFELYLEAADVCVEGGESLQATQMLKRASKKFPSNEAQVMLFAQDKLRATGDSVLAKYLLERAIKGRKLDEAREVLEDLPDRAVRDLLQRTRTKKQSLTSASHGGYSLKGETVLNALSDAMLSLRLGRVKDSMTSFLKLLDEKPVENEVLQPFFASIEKTFPKSGRIRFALGCSLIASHNIPEAMRKLVSAARTESSLAVECLERIRHYSDTVEEVPFDVDRAVIELLMIEGDVDRAAELLQESLDKDPDLARNIVEMVGPQLEKFSNSDELNYVFLNAALMAEQTLRIIETIKRIKQEPGNTARLLSWLDCKAAEQFLPADVMLLHGEVAIAEKEYERATEVLTAVANNSANDVPSVLTLLERHKRADERLAKLFDELAAKQGGERATASKGSTEDFEHFETSDFQFSSAKEDAFEVKPDPETKEALSGAEPLSLGGDYEEDPEFDNFSGRSVFGNTKKSESETILWEEEDANGEVETAGDAAASGAPSNETLDDTAQEKDGTAHDPAASSEPEEPAYPADYDDDAEAPVIEKKATGEFSLSSHSGGRSRPADDVDDASQPDEAQWEDTSQTDEVPSEDTTQADDVQREDTTEAGASQWDDTNQASDEPPNEDAEQEESVELAVPVEPAAEQEEAVELAVPVEPVSEDEPEPVRDENPEQETPAITDEHVMSVAEGLYRSGAATFFHIDQDDSAGTTQSEEPAAAASDEGTPSTPERPAAEEPTTSPEPVQAEDADAAVEAVAEEADADAPTASDEAPPVEEMDTRSTAAAADEVQPEAEAEAPAAEPEETQPASAAAPKEELEADTASPQVAEVGDSFEERFDAYLRGELSNDDVIALMAEAVEGAHENELRELLYFEPASDEEKFARRLYQVDYHMMRSRPLAALEIIAEIQKDINSDEQRKQVWYKRAVCQRTVGDFEAANQTLNELRELAPDSEEIERLARRNHQQYLQNQSEGAPVLEKTTSLNTDL